MDDYTELENYIEAYMDPTTLGDKILQLLNKELYNKDPVKYNNLMADFYTETILQAKSSTYILYHWLECSNFTAPKALKYLVVPNTLYNLVETPYDNNIKTKALTLWFASQPSTEIPTLFNVLGANLTSEHLDEINQLKLVIAILLPNKQDLTQIQLGLNSILRGIDLNNVPDVDAVRLMSLYPHIKPEIVTQIASLYNTETEFKKYLATAEALDIVDNPDYWVQSLPSQQKTSLDITVSLPTFE